MFKNYIHIEGHIKKIETSKCMSNDVYRPKVYSSIPNLVLLEKFGVLHFLMFLYDELLINKCVEVAVGVVKSSEMYRSQFSKILLESPTFREEVHKQ